MNQVPCTREGVAARGLQVAVRMLATKNNTSIDAVLMDLFMFLNTDGRACSLGQIEKCYSFTGLSKYMVNGTLKFFKEQDIKVSRHQLMPTKAVLAGYGIYE